MTRKYLLAVLLCGAAACSNAENETAPTTPPPVAAEAPVSEVSRSERTGEIPDLDTLARKYIAVALAFGQYDENYVDAYTGPEDWRESALAAEKSLEDLFADAVTLASELALVSPETGDEKRLDQMSAVVAALIARIRMARGETLAFDEETALLYDAIAPRYDLADFDAALAAMEDVLPGEGPLPDREKAFRDQLVVPADKVQAVMEKAIDECRTRTKQRYVLPEEETFTLEFVNDKPWSAYNYYQGDYNSLIQVNLDAPFLITRALDLGCHEGYPGHHVWNIYMEREFLRKNNWIEYYVFPLYSPAAFFAEGSANYGLNIAFPGEDKMAFERDVLYPIADIDPALAEPWEEISSAKRKLANSRNHIAREYLDGRMSREEAVAMTMKYGLVTEERANQSVDFMDTYRGYVINYTLGKDMVEAYVEAKATSEEDRWRIFEDMLKVPLRASDLVVE